ncbi:MAG: ASKHA domain-containing protein [Anaerovoracaceae bacterium]
MIVTFQPIGRKQEAFLGDNLLQVAEKASILIDANCTGKGICGNCKIRILAGEAGPLDKIEREFLTDNEIKCGWRLACRVKVIDNLIVQIPNLHKGVDRKKDLFWLPKDFLPDQYLFQEEENGYGIAFDIGTTTVVGMLWDLKNGTLINTVARTNPQSIYGGDIISRIMFCSQKDGNLQLMQEMILNCLNDIVNQLIQRNKINTDDIQEVTIAGNTTMSHLLLNIDPSTLAKAPFKPNFYGPISINAEALDLAIYPEALIHILPNIEGHVGSDITAVLLASGLRDLDGANLAIDVGTNGEILLAYKGKVLTCSTAAGPAFEGASISRGMRAAKGAIEAVKICNGVVELSIIDDNIPVGICGSGLIDSISEMLSTGIISKTGKLINNEEAKKIELPEEIIKRLHKSKNGDEFVLYRREKDEDITINQKDIREVQLAKGAISAGITLLMKELNINVEDLNHIFLAGAFGNYINKKSALKIGLLPKVSEEKVVSIGNAAGVGTCMALLSKTAREHSYNLAKETKHVELADHPDFQETFLQAMYF